MTKRALILDLDGTLFFKERRPESLVIKGRRRDTCLARETINALKHLQDHYAVILATGRSITSVNIIASQLVNEGLDIKGMVAENGGVWIDKGGKTHILVSPKWLTAIQEAAQSVKNNLPEFSTSLALLTPPQSEIARAQSILQKHGLKHHLFKDGNKLFFLAEKANKYHALVYGIGAERLSLAVGAGNDLNDIEWLNSVKHPAAPGCAHEEIKKIVTVKGGLLAQACEHDGILEVLEYFKNIS